MVVIGLGVAGCGSDDDQTPASTPSTTIVDGRQAPGPNGNNNNNGQATTSLATTDAPVTGDTQDKVDDQSPGGGNDNGMPGSTGP